MGDFWDTDNAVQKMAYDTLNGEIKRTMRRSARDMVQIGCLLKIMMDKMMWQEYYSCFDDYLRSELQMDYTMATRFMKATEKYSVGGNSMEIKEKYEGYSQAVLIEMLNMPPELEEKVAPGMTVKQVREVKRQTKKKEEDSKSSDTVIDGDYREIDTPEQETAVLEEVATSQPDDSCEVHDERWFVEQYVRFRSEESKELMEICLREKNNSDRANAIYKHIAPYGYHCGGCVEFGFAFRGFAAGVNLYAGKEKIRMTYRGFAAELFRIAEEVATSQPVRSAYGLEKTEYPEGSLIAEAGCGHKYDCFSCAQACSIRGENRYCRFAPLGNPFDCEMMEILEKGDLEKGVGDRCQFVNNDLAYHTAGSGEASPCCRECKETCEYRCQRSVQGDETEEENESEVIQETEEPEADAETKDDFEPLDELGEIRKILEQEKKLLHDYLEVGDIPERTVFRQKTIVAALAAMIFDLEEADQKEEQAEQPELPDMINDESCKAFINAYRQWPIWIDIKETGERYYRYQFKNGASFVVKECLHMCLDHKNSSKKPEEGYHDSWNPEEYYIFLGEKPFKDCRSSKYGMIGFLEDLQREGRRIK